MDVTQGTPDGGSLSAVNGSWVLTKDSATGRFARRFTCALPSGRAGGRFPLAVQNTACTLSFPTYDFDARAGGAAESVTRANSGSDGVKLTFPTARTVLRVKVQTRSRAT